MNKADKKWIKDTMDLFPFVKFDRYIPDEEFIEVYGWIDRKDTYKDFVVLEFNLSFRTWSHLATSSVKYSKRISKILDEPRILCISIKELLN